VFAEAQAMGTPVVSFGHGGIREIVDDGTTGLLAPERDYISLAKAITRYIADPEFRRRSSEAAIEHVRARANLAIQTSLLEDVYDAVVNGKEVPQSLCSPVYEAPLQPL
jgi:glycosyltransferase involved in cell wall biosynthesis